MVFEKLRGANAPVPEHFEFAVWIDFSCLDQDGSPAEEVKQSLKKIISCCYLVVTPVVDETHGDWHYAIMWTRMANYQPSGGG